jgi:hypothetical protein
MAAIRTLSLVSVLALVAVACSPGVPAALPTQTGRPVVQPDATPTPLATERKATPQSGSYYKPPGWDGASDVNCKDFDTHAHAQSFFKGTGGSASNDPYGLDGDHDGTACETLP